MWRTRIRGVRVCGCCGGVVVAMACCAPPATPRQPPGRRSCNYRSSSAALAKLVLCVCESGEALFPEPAELEVGLARPSLGLGTRRDHGSKGGGRRRSCQLPQVLVSPAGEVPALSARKARPLAPHAGPVPGRSSAHKPGTGRRGDSVEDVGETSLIIIVIRLSAEALWGVNGTQ